MNFLLVVIILLLIGILAMLCIICGHVDSIEQYKEHDNRIIYNIERHLNKMKGKQK